MGFSSSGGDAASLRRTELPGCHLHFFRHVSKASGTTVRFIFDKQVVMGEWEFLPMCHYGFREKDWKETVRRFREAAVDANRVKSGTGPRVIVEARNEWGASEAFEEVILKDLKKLKLELRALGCGVTTSLLFREPKAQYESFWKYYIQKLRDDPDASALDKGPEAWGETFEAWAKRVPDLQLRELLGNRCTPKLREPLFDTAIDAGSGKRRTTAARALPETCKISLGDRSRFENLIRQIDVVGTTDRFDLFWLQLADAAGFQHLEYSPSNEAKDETNANGRGDDDDEDASSTTYDFSGSIVNDAWAYDLVAKTRDERVARRCASSEEIPKVKNEFQNSDECELRARVAAFTASSAIGNDRKKRVGGIPPVSRYMFADAVRSAHDSGERKTAVAKDPKDWIRPDFYVSPPVCKGFFSELVGLVYRNDTRYRCDRGCSFE